MDGAIMKDTENGYVETMFSRRRVLHDIRSSNRTVRGVAERNAINAPIQGFAADIMKLAMVEIHRRFKHEGIRSQMIMQVHDELIIECPEQIAGAVAELISTEMEQVASLNVPLVAEAKWGNSWYEAK